MDIWCIFFGDKVEGVIDFDELLLFFCFFIFSKGFVYEEIFCILREELEDIIIVVVVGLFINVVFVVVKDFEIFFCVKEFVVMGGVVNIIGNVIFVVEFNCMVDVVVVVRVYVFMFKVFLLMMLLIIYGKLVLGVYFEKLFC